MQYNPKSWFTTISCVLVLVVFQLDFQPTIGLHSILGIVLGLFLVLRTNTAYDRWWEGRMQWGQLVNDTRALAMKINAFVPREEEDHRGFFQKSDWQRSGRHERAPERYYPGRRNGPE